MLNIESFPTIQITYLSKTKTCGNCIKKYVNFSKTWQL